MFLVLIVKSTLYQMQQQLVKLAVFKMYVSSVQVVAPLSGYYSLSSSSSSVINLSPVETSYHDLSFTLHHIQPTITLIETPIFIRGGDPLGILAAEPPPSNTDDEYYIHLETHKKIGNETHALDPTQFLQPILRPSVALSYECNDLVTYIGGSVVDRHSLSPTSPLVVEYGEVLVEDTIPEHEFQRPVEHTLHAQGTILSGASVELLASSTFIMVGPIPVQFGKLVSYIPNLAHMLIPLMSKM